MYIFTFIFIHSIHTIDTLYSANPKVLFLLFHNRHQYPKVNIRCSVYSQKKEHECLGHKLSSFQDISIFNQLSSNVTLLYHKKINKNDGTRH